MSRPVRFPAAGGGNMWLRGGTIRALPTFVTSANHTDAVVEMVGTTVQFGDVNFEDLTIDAAGYASGGLRIEKGCRIHVWECTVVGFSTIGIYAGPVFGGFVYILNSYVGVFDDDYRNFLAGASGE